MNHVEFGGHKKLEWRVGETEVKSRETSVEKFLFLALTTQHLGSTYFSCCWNVPCSD